MAKMTARQHILAYLDKLGSGTAGQIGRGLGMSAATVRHHLSILQTDGRVVLVAEKPAGGRGRPNKVYRLSEKVIGDNLGNLVEVLFEAIPMKSRGKDRDPISRSLAEKMIGRIGPLPAEGGAAKRLAALVDALNRKHYRARWEAGAEGPRVIFGNCPYAAVIRNHPELCRMDGAILSGELGGEATQLAKIDLKNGPAYCMFVLKQP